LLEHYFRREREFESEWLPAPFVPPRELTLQSSGICFTEGGRITLVSDGKGWVFPGGWPEDGETLEQALVREVAEEACARVVHAEYLGSVLTYERTRPLPPGAREMGYQARYWARVEHDLFAPRHEMTLRTEVEPTALVAMLRWNAKRTAQEILDAALAVERRFSGRPR
jgi:ADP-ribose pyrophosphatase YjhB (NUDIX family)